MKILQLCKKFPFPVKDGETIAITQLARSLHQLGCEVTLLCMNTSRHFLNAEKELPSVPYYKTIHHVEVDNRLQIKDAFVNLFSEDSYHIQRFESTPFKHKLIELLAENDFDVVQLETLYLAPYVPFIRMHASHTLISMRAHNVEHEIWERIAEHTSFTPKKWYIKHLSEKLKDYEISRINSYDLLVSITEKDRQLFRQLGRKGETINIPIGLDSQGYTTKSSLDSSPLSISFIGSLDWMPNQEGMNWFLDEIWPGLIQRFPELILHIAGRNAKEWSKGVSQQNVVLHGEVPDAQAFINAHPIMVVPLKSGSGMRVKILEGMALSKVVITTSMGLEGIHAKDGKEVLIADDQQAFVDIIENCYQNRSTLKLIGKNARKFVEKEFDSLTIAKRLATKYQSMLSDKPVPARR